MSAPLPPHIAKLKEITGIELANCESCIHGHRDTDGEVGEIYCGTTCGKRPNMACPTYIEDEDDLQEGEKPLDPLEEKACWEPCFWHSKELATKIDGTDESMMAAMKEWRAAVDPQIPNPPIPYVGVSRCGWCGIKFPGKCGWEEGDLPRQRPKDCGGDQ